MQSDAVCSRQAWLVCVPMVLLAIRIPMHPVARKYSQRCLFVRHIIVSDIVRCEWILLCNSPSHEDCTDVSDRNSFWLFELFNPVSAAITMVGNATDSPISRMSRFFAVLARNWVCVARAKQINLEILEIYALAWVERCSSLHWGALIVIYLWQNGADTASLRWVRGESVIISGGMSTFFQRCCPIRV